MRQWLYVTYTKHHGFGCLWSPHPNEKPSVYWLTKIQAGSCKPKPLEKSLNSTSKLTPTWDPVAIARLWCTSSHDCPASTVLPRADASGEVLGPGDCPSEILSLEIPSQAEGTSWLRRPFKSFSSLHHAVIVTVHLVCLCDIRSSGYTTGLGPLSLSVDKDERLLEGTDVAGDSVPLTLTVPSPSKFGELCANLFW